MSVDLNALLVFVKVVQKGSFAEAARALVMPRSTVSQRISELEERLGARLLQRTTRTLSVTDEGRIYYDHCARILGELDEADREVTSLQQEPRGLLRVTVPACTPLLARVFADFLRRYREVRLDVLYTDRFVDLVEESYDVALRAGRLPDSTLMARSIGVLPYRLVASPRYLAERGRPRTPQDLAAHSALVFEVGPSPRVWRLTQGKVMREVTMSPALAANELDVLIEAALAGVGIANVPAHRSTDHVRSKRLEHVLPGWEALSVPMHALYPSVRHLSPKVRAMLEHLQSMKQAPWFFPDDRAADATPLAGPGNKRSRREGT